MSSNTLKSTKKLAAAGIMALMATLTACSSITADDYVQNRPLLNIAEYFSGNLTAHGIIKNRAGKVTRYFNVDMAGKWDDSGRGTLTEHFTYDDGEYQQRIWSLTPDATGSYWGDADDVKAPAKMHTSGNALFMRYKLEIPFGKTTLYINVDDRMYLTDSDSLVSESQLSKFGINVGSILLVILKNDTE